MVVSWSTFGAATVTLDGHPVALTRRPRMVLLRLLLEPNRGVSWERVASFLWGDEPPRTQRNSIARFVADLRRLLGEAGERIVTDGGGYRVVVLDGELDADVVRRTLNSSRDLARTDLDRAVALVEEAWSLVGVEPNPWLDESLEASAVLARSGHDRLAILDLLTELKMAQGRYAELIGTLEHAAELHPYHEKLSVDLAAVLQRSGRIADALRVHQRLRRSLAEIGLQPSPPTVAAERHVVSGSPARASLGMWPQGDSPAGRLRELRAISSALKSARLLTVTGVAAAGKSTLADAACRDEELGGTLVHRVDMRSLRDASRVVPSIAGAVGVPASLAVGSPAQLARHLQSVSCLVLLDNCEHLRSTCADVAEAIITGADGVRMLVTSCEPLGIDAEQVFRLELLQTSTQESEHGLSAAAEVFLRASNDADGVDPYDNEPGAGRDVEIVESICASLDGHPLAVTLASRLAADMAEADLCSRLLISPAGSRTDATSLILDVIWERLTLDEQTVLARLSVFALGCTLDSARYVCGEVVSETTSLDSLVERSVVRRSVEGRYVLDAVVRAYASDRLADRLEREATLDRLGDWIRDLTARWGVAALGSVAAASEVLRPEQANIIEVLEHLRSQGRSEELAWFSIRSCGLWINHGMYTEVVRWLGPIVDDPSVSRPARCAAATLLLESDLTIGKFDTMEAWGVKAIELSDGEAHDWIPALAGFMALWSLLFVMEVPADDYLDMAEALAERSDSRSINLAHAKLRRAQIAHHRREYARAADYFREAKELVEEPGRQLLAIEMGETISLYLGGQRDEALASVLAWRSTVGTDEWHYMVDIVRSIIIGGSGEPESATVELAAAIRRQEPVAVWARSEEFQLAFGLLAGMRGERELSDRLLANLTTGSPFLKSIVIEYVLAARGLPSESYHDVALELLSPTIETLANLDLAGNADQLVDWWASGSDALIADQAG